MRSGAQMMDPCLMIHHGHSQIRSVVLVFARNNELNKLLSSRLIERVLQRFGWSLCSKDQSLGRSKQKIQEIPKPWKTQEYKSLYKWWFSCQSDQLQDPGTAATSENCGSSLECIWQSLKRLTFQTVSCKVIHVMFSRVIFSFDLVEASLPVSSSEVSSFSETHIWIYLNMSMQSFFGVLPKKTVNLSHHFTAEFHCLSSTAALPFSKAQSQPRPAPWTARRMSWKL